MKFIAISLAATFASTAAFAGGFVDPVTGVDAVPVSTSSAGSWTGFYAGLQFGAGDATFSFAGETASEDTDAGGFHLGYMRDFGQVVVGGEFAFDRVTLSDGDDDEGVYLGRLRGRIGYNAGRFMPYATIGSASLVGEDNDDISEAGFTYGIGADFRVTDRFLVGFDYSRSEFSDVLDEPGLDLDADLVQVRASFKF